MKHAMNRRRFAKLLGAGAAYIAAAPGLTLANPLDADSTVRSIKDSSVIRLSSNENPYGPSPLALKAMSKAFGLAWRYPDEHADMLVKLLAKVNSVGADQILLGDGSGEILKLCAAAFTGPSANGDRPITVLRSTRGTSPPFMLGRGKLVVADPTFEAIINHAAVNGAEVVKVPLTSGFAHDLPQMLAAASEGLIYVCNPNNPTASITPKVELRDFISKVPGSTMILVDEAYHHYADSADYESVVPLVNQYPNLIVARTFSKIYGMAGLRCGYGVAQRETIQRLRPHQTWDSMNIMALAAAIASLNDASHVGAGAQRNRETRNMLSGELEKMGYKHIPSQANFMMIDVKQPVSPLIAELKTRGVEVGRLFPALPNYMRVTIGKKSEIETFLAAFREVTASTNRNLN
ncbi:MAG TPA: aminotransferase class I/II-fold pyridoxal phosphate-dependent enzyme [Pyrinomonadaceae bacterium]|nr:aminotransferase class I/II-fold pyridoxal phosphate-dependent enzyme [Pyrinomonadaceae bacterium]